MPLPPPDLLPATRGLWKEFWGSACAKLVDSSVDVIALRQLFTLYDERERAYQAYRKQRYVRGSKGQPVLNPIWKHARALEAEIRRLEDRFGVSPRARQQLGITTSTAPSLEDLNRDLEGDEDAGRDPRLAAR